MNGSAAVSFSVNDVKYFATKRTLQQINCKRRRDCNNRMSKSFEHFHPPNNLYGYSASFFTNCLVITNFAIIVNITCFRTCVINIFVKTLFPVMRLVFSFVSWIISIINNIINCIFLLLMDMILVAAVGTKFNPQNHKVVH